MPDPVPQYLPREHVGLFQRHRALARIFDQAFRVPGTNWRFGLDALLGLFPGIGDLLPAGAAGKELLQTWLPNWLSGYRDAFVFLFLIGMLLFRPNGLLGQRGREEMK